LHSYAEKLSTVVPARTKEFTISRTSELRFQECSANGTVGRNHNERVIDTLKRFRKPKQQKRQKAKRQKAKQQKAKPLRFAVSYF
jgi:hypothetical protein